MRGPKARSQSAALDGMTRTGVIPRAKPEGSILMRGPKARSQSAALDPSLRSG